jgi:2-phosphosulfolactate phosphatase
MAQEREVRVHLLPALVPEGSLAGGVAVVIDVLRATTAMVYALAAGCTAIRPCAEVEEARELARSLPPGRALLAGERGGLPLPGFDLSNSPAEYTPAVCGGREVVLTTTNGTRALLRAAGAARVLAAAFVNFSAVCEQLRQDARAVHVVCAGTEGEVTLEDVLLAGAFVDFLSGAAAARPNDSARLARDSFTNNRHALLAALEVSKGGTRLRRIGYEQDIRAAARVDRFALVPELRRDPLRVEVGAAGAVPSHWPG